MNKTDLIQKVKALDGLSQDERAYLINLVNTKKKYGLVWEDKPEEVEEQLRENLPVLKEVKEKAIIASSSFKINESLFNDYEQNNAEAPNHILIEGDNLHALTALTFTHEGKIDLIYIDPPYNTGNKTWRYNNDYVEYEDSFRHSKWLSFISKRISIAKKLLKEDGVIIATIDDYEIFQLGLLMDEVFGEENCLGIITVENKPSGRTTDKFFATSHEYYLYYCKNPSQVTVNKLFLTEDQSAEYRLSDEISSYKWRDFLRTGGFSTPEERPNSYYPIYFDPNTNRASLNISEGAVEILPIDSKGVNRVWRRTRPTFMEDYQKGDILISKNKGGRWKIQIKDRIKTGIKPKTVWYNPKYDASSHGTKLLETILGDARSFDFPKSLWAVKDSIDLVLRNKKTSVILDFFAGSGTTLHATMQLNAEDSGNRQCILVTNNENNICEEVTYERNKRIIQGYTNAKGIAVEGLTNNNLRYYKSEFVGRETSLKNKRELTQLATDLLCIKEDCYTDQKLLIKQAKLFANARVSLLILFDDHIIPDAVELIKGMDAKEIKVYVFSMGSDPYTEDFAEVLDKVTLCALPDAIYKAYQHVLPKKKRTVPLMEEVSETPTNENGEQLSIL